VKKQEQPSSVFSSSFDDDFNRLHGRLLTSFDVAADKLWQPSSKWASDIMTVNDNSVDVKNEGDVFQVTVESADFRPEELKVSTLNDNLLKIEGRHVEEGSVDNGNKYVSRQFSRSYTLPSTCKAHEMRSSFANGKLVVTVPKTKPAITAEDSKVKSGGGGRVRTIPIQSKTPFFTDKEAAAGYKTSREVNIDDSIDEDMFKRSNRLFDSANWPSSRATMGGGSFGDWIRPIQLFDEDLFMDSFQRPESFFNQDFKMAKSSLSSSATKVDVKETDDQFQFILPTDDYDPKELKVSVLDDVLKIEGQHVEEDSEDRGEDGNSKVKRRHVTKQFSRSYVLPKHIYRMDQVESSLNTRQKRLVVKVPKIKQASQGQNRAVNVPIKML